MNRTLLRRAAPIAAALVLGGGAGAGVYAGLDSGSAAPATTTTVVASVPAQSAATTATSTPLTQLYKNSAPGVVDITVTASQTGDQGFPFGPQQQQQSQAEGSGFVYDTSGDIVTNAHVVEGATAIKVRFQDGTTAKATLVGKDESTDIAVIKVDVASSKLHPLPLGTSATVQPGQSVVAIGSPFGLPETMTAGIVSAVDRTITAPNQYSISGAIQTDAAINHGNSGGPLLDASTGKVIGVNAQIESNSNDNAGVGFAIPIDAVKDVADTVIAGKTVQHAYLGVRISDASSGEGAQVSRLIAGSPADKAGVQVGDVITAIDGKAITGADDLTARVATYSPGDKATLTVTRNGATKTIAVTFGQRPS